MATNPWDAYPAVPQQASQGDPVIARDPYKVNAESRAEEDQRLQREAAARAARNEEARIEMERERLRLAQNQAGAGNASNGATVKTATMESLVDQINRVTDLYNKGISKEGMANLWGALDAIGPQAGQFDSAGQGVADQALSVFRVPGIGAQSDLEARQFASANTPQAGDWDVRIEEKLLNLRRRVDASRKAMGLPPAKWAELNPGLEVNVSDDSDQEGLTGAVTAERSGNGVPPTGGSGGTSFNDYMRGELGVPDKQGGYLDALAQGTGSVVEGIASIPALVVDPLSTTLGRALGYDNYTSDFAGRVRSDLGFSENQDKTADTIIKGGTAGLTGAGAARAGAFLANPGAVRNALNVFGATPIRDAAAGAAGAGGGVVGKEIGGVPGQIVGTLAGGVAGYSGANALARVTQGSRAPNALVLAANRQGVELMPAETGGPVARAMTTGTKASPLSVSPVVKQAQKQQGQMADATRRIAESQGEVVTTDIAGGNIRRAAQEHTKQTAERGARLYDRAGQAAKGVKIKPLQTIQRLDAYIARAKENPVAGSTSSELASFRDNIANGVSVQGLRDARTALSNGVYDGKLRSGPEQAMWKDILGSLSDDIDNGLRSVGKGEAATMFRRADEFWKSRVEHIDQVLQPLLGKDKSGEQVVDAIEGMARGKQGGSARLSRLLANMPDQEAGNIRATLIDRIGKASPGAQNAEGNVFSANTFLTNWNKMTPQAKASLFSDTSLRRDMDDIAKLAEGMKVSQSMANHSNTGVAVGSNSAVGAGLLVTHPVAAVVGAGAQYLTGRAMASPKIAAILARSAKLPPEVAARRLPEQLKVLAVREPALASDIKGLQQYLVDAFGQSPVRAAASDQETNGRRKPIQ